MTTYLLVGGPLNGTSHAIPDGANDYGIRRVKPIVVTDYDPTEPIDFAQPLPFETVMYCKWQLTKGSRVFYVHFHMKHMDPDAMIDFILTNYTMRAK